MNTDNYPEVVAWRAGRDCFLTELVGFLGPIPSLQMRLLSNICGTYLRLGVVGNCQGEHLSLHIISY